MLPTQLRHSPRQIRHPHNFHHQTSPPCKMRRALSLSRLRIILLPREIGFRPLVIDGFDEIEAELSIEI